MSSELPQAWSRVTDPRAARLLLDPASRRFFEPFLLAEHSVKSAAGMLGVALGATHHRVRQFERCGLLRVTRQEARRGRPIKYYAASAQAYLLPLSGVPELTLEALVEQEDSGQQALFEAHLVRCGLGLVNHLDEVALRLYRTPQGVRSDITPRAEGFDWFRDSLTPGAPAIWSTWSTVHLTHQDAKALQSELAALMQRYANRGGPQGYTLRLGLVPEQR